MTDISVGEVLDSLPRQAKVKKSDYLPSGDIPVIDQGSDFIGGYTNDQESAYKGDLPVIVFGDHTRILKWVPHKFAVGADGTQLLRPDNRFQPRYFYYALKNLNLKAYGYERHFKYLKEEKLALRDVAEQCRIAAILTTYDDLIENNTRRIAVLEEMARRIYEEWFVRFRFPGHEQVRMVESELGLIPEGWEVAAATAAIDVNPTTKVPKDGEKPFLPMNCLSDGSMLITGHEWRDGNSGAKFRNGDTLFARITPCLENGKTGYVQFLPSDDAVAFGSTEFIVLRSRTLCPEFVYAMARSDAFRDNAIKSMSGATGRQRVKEACFDSFYFAQPDRETLGNFENVVRPMFKAIQNFAKKNANLRTTRDLLLPKLISGELDVSHSPEMEAIPS